jgi:hypothetical protein
MHKNIIIEIILIANIFIKIEIRKDAFANVSAIKIVILTKDSSLLALNEY